VFFGSKTAAILRSFVASCQRVGVDPFVWLKDILSRIANHPITRLAELSPTQLGFRPGLNVITTLMPSRRRASPARSKSGHYSDALSATRCTDSTSKAIEDAVAT
jgi:hypothetical protein